MSFMGQDLSRLSVEERIERGLCLVHETRELFADMTVTDNLLLGAYSRYKRSTNQAETEAAARAKGPLAFYLPVTPGGMGERDVKRFAELMRTLPGPVLGYCRSGARSYNAVRALMQEGIDAYNIAGSFLAMSWHEYYQDQAQGRESALTGYNFE